MTILSLVIVKVIVDKLWLYCTWTSAPLETICTSNSVVKVIIMTSLMAAFFCPVDWIGPHHPEQYDHAALALEQETTSLRLGSAHPRPQDSKLHPLELWAAETKRQKDFDAKHYS